MYRDFIGPEPLSRLQIAVAGILVLECVGHIKDLRNIWADWCESRSINGLPPGGSIMYLASKPRTWDVTIGNYIED